MTSQQQGPAQKKCRVECQSHKERCTQITALRKAATCSILGCSFVFEGEAHICSVCSAGVCPSCHKRMVASPNVPNDRCSIGGCKLPHGGGSPVELRTGGVRIELAACVVQACAGEGCHQTGTWSELRAHSPWCVAAEVNCPFCEEPLKRADLKKHLTEHHGAPLVETTRSTESPSSNDSSSDSDSDSSDSDSARRRDGTVTIGVWELDVRRAPLSVAIVVGRCKKNHHCIGGEAPAQCACPFVIATARTCFYDDIPTTHVSVFTVFTEVTALRHPMGHCEVSMHATDKSPCGALVSSRCARAYPVLARCDGGPRFAMTGGLVDCEKRDLSVRRAGPRVVFRFTTISANIKKQVTK